MGENSKIEWCDHTFNPWRGCTKVSPGCLHCYAETQAKRNPKTLGVWGRGQPRVLASDDMWKNPLKWDLQKAHECPSCGTVHLAFSYHEAWECDCTSRPTICRPRRPRVFCASFADWLDEEVPLQWRVDLLNLIAKTPNLDWLLLTKRIGSWKARMLECAYAAPIAADWLLENAPPNVWLGATVENQAMADERIPDLLKIAARVRFLSCEPLLGALDLRLNRNGHSLRRTIGQDLHWVIAGGESGPGARPMNPDWARSIRDQCKAAKVPFLFKQWGEWVRNADIHTGRASTSMIVPYGDGDPTKFRRMYRVGKKAAGRLLDGQEHNGFPVMEGRPA